MRETMRRRLERVEAETAEAPLKIDMEALSDADLRVLASIPIVRDQEACVMPPDAQRLWEQLEQVNVGRTVYLRRRQPAGAH